MMEDTEAALESDEGVNSVLLVAAQVRVCVFVCVCACVCVCSSCHIVPLHAILLAALL